MKRLARITNTSVVPDQAKFEVAAYLPDNYHVSVIERDQHGCVTGVVIEGEDKMGWTLDDYVLPRLASGNYQGEEIGT